MIRSSKKEGFAAHNENISYYDEIAGGYDLMLEREDSNKMVRQKVKEKFTALVESGWVLDFGGGTGLDLDWLKAMPYNIIFCEPSTQMREKAKQHLNKTPNINNNIIFLETANTDFTLWHKAAPFSRPVDGILANFGVLNNIQDIDIFFKNLSLIIRPGGHLLALFLERPFSRMWKWHRRNAIRSLIFNKPFIMYTWHNGYRQTVFVYTANEIKKAAAPFFDYMSCEHLGGFGFELIHLVRK